MLNLRPRHHRASFLIKPIQYGRSVYGAPLLYFPAQINSDNAGLIFAGTHGDETASISTLSCALRSIEPNQLQHNVILSINPDGNQLGIRSNANCVDLNRNFPTQNQLHQDTVYRWNSSASSRDVVIKTASSNKIEPETQSLIELINQLKPKFTVSFHEPLACVDDPNFSRLALWLSKQFSLPVVKDVGYETPGSFGTWCQENRTPCVTVELPAISADSASETYINPMIRLLTSHYSSLTKK